MCLFSKNESYIFRLAGFFFVLVLFGVQSEGPENLFHGLIKNYCMAVIVNGIVFNLTLEFENFFF